MNEAYSLAVVREKIEWCKIWVPDSAEAILDCPRVLLVGDSIVVGFGPRVSESLNDVASVAWLGTSRFPTDPAFREEVLLVLRHTRFDLVYFNNGLHGYGNSEEEYGYGMRSALEEFRDASGDARWIVGSSTPIRVAGKPQQWHERMPRLRKRNQMAEELAREFGLPFADLFSEMKDHPELHDEDGIHFNEEGQKAQAAFVAEILRRELRHLNVCGRVTMLPEKLA